MDKSGATDPVDLRDALPRAKSVPCFSSSPYSIPSYLDTPLRNRTKTKTEETFILDSSSDSDSDTDTLPTLKSLRILVFSWNTKSVRFTNCTWSGLISTLNITNEDPDFFDFYRQQIVTSSPDLVAIGFQEDCFPGGNFHSHVLVDEMHSLGYKLLKRNRLIGIGKTTLDAIYEYSLKLRGLRTSIYCRSSLLDSIRHDPREIEMSERLGYDAQTYYTTDYWQSKGGLISYVNVPGFKTIAIVNCHLPHNSQSLIDAMKENNYMIRHTALTQSNIHFNNMVDLAKVEDIGYLILFGDLNYRVVYHQFFELVSADECVERLKQGTMSLARYYENDELKMQMDKCNIYYMSEGVDGKGPRFKPTCKFSTRVQLCCTPVRTESFTNGDVRSYKTGKYKQRYPSWTDRILYLGYNDDSQIECIEYNSFCTGEVMKMSDHDGVYGLFELS